MSHAVEWLTTTSSGCDGDWHDRGFLCFCFFFFFFSLVVAHTVGAAMADEPEFTQIISFSFDEEEARRMETGLVRRAEPSVMICGFMEGGKWLFVPAAAS